ncbi:MAG: CRP/FNR family cyclic AMP-dependent transcriptional regulator [Arenicella sp.]
MISLFKKTYSPQERAIFRFLRKNELFSELTDKELSEFLPFMHLRNYKENEVVFFRGDPSQALYVVKKGIISLNIDVENQFEELMQVKTSSFFGDNSLLPNKYRIYHAVCVSESAQIYVLPRLNIVEVFESNLKIKSKMMTAMANYYNDYTSQLFTSYRESFGFFDLTKVFSKR